MLGTRRRQVVGIVAVAMMLVLAWPISHAQAQRPGAAGLVASCEDHIFNAIGNASPVSEPVAPSLIRAFSVLGQSPPAKETHPPDLPDVLGQVGVESYDATAVRFLTRAPSGDHVYVIPVVLRRASAPADCAQVSSLDGYQAYLRMEAVSIGSGPGVCVLSVESPLGSEYATCESLGVMGRPYFGPTGLDVLLGETNYFDLVEPDAVRSLTLSYDVGHPILAPSISHLAKLANNLLYAEYGGSPTKASIRAELKRVLPASVAVHGAGGRLLSYARRPAWALGLYVQAETFYQSIVSHDLLSA